MGKCPLVLPLSPGSSLLLGTLGLTGMRPSLLLCLPFGECLAMSTGVLLALLQPGFIRMLTDMGIAGSCMPVLII
jgi:hypothetical protein